MKKILLFLILVVCAMFGGCSGKVFAENFVENLPDFYIKAVNPGYTVDGVSNVGEMIEIGRTKSDDSVSLAGLALGYTNSSGKEVLLVDFSKYLWMTGETFILQLASSPSSGLAQVLYSTTLALKAGPLNLYYDDEVIDSVCWTGKDGCKKAFSSSNPTSLVRNMETGDFEHWSFYDSVANGVLEVKDDADFDGDSAFSSDDIVSQCKGLEFSEILSYYDTLQDEQFVELHNSNTEAIRLDGCVIKYKNKNYPLSGMIFQDGYFVRLATDFKLTKNPVTSNILELIDTDGTILDKLVYPNGQRKGTAYALVGYDSSGKEIWKTTYLPTPGEPNIYQEFRTCEEGKVINEVTGNCVKVVSVSEKICGEGQYLNILTGRCKKIPESTEKVCKEGYYLNEETGRCRKITENTGADYTLVPETYAEETSFVALYLVLGAIGIGLIYIGYEFRHEMARFLRRMKWW